MIRASLSLLLFSGALHAAAGPLRLAPPVQITPPAAGDTPSAIRYLGQPARDGRIDLTATNGFFDRCFQAGDPGPALPGDEGLIGASFGHLQKGAQDHGTARWHLWCPRPGEVRATIHMDVPADEAGHPWEFRFGGQARALATRAGNSPQPQRLFFEVAEPGRHTFTIDCRDTPPPPDTRIRFITLEGPAVAASHLLRVRWRPAAVHQAFAAPDSCPAPDMWVFETRSLSQTSSCSPLTTPFGYYGTSFNSDGRIPAGASFNFSMWLAGRDAEHAPPINQMPRILATGLADAEFDHFSHEGTGVKLRHATAYPHGAERTFHMDDFASHGWMAMATGGIEQYVAALAGEPVMDKAEPAPLADYLAPDKLAQLFSLPVRFGAPAAVEVSATTAVIDYPLLETGTDSKGTLYYGTTDALTYPVRTITGGSAALREMFGPERTWQHNTPPTPVTPGPNTFRLAGLAPGTTYHFRLFVEHAGGKSWGFRSGTFHTQPRP